MNAAMMRGATPLLFGVAVILHAPFNASADDKWPERSVTVVVGNPPAGTNDIITRLYAPHLSKELGRPVIVENKVGAGGSLATDFVARTQPNGYTFLMQASTVHAGMPLARKGLPWSPSDFRGVAMAAQAWYVVTATTKVPARSLKEFIAYGKANPGKLNYATLGTGSLPHLGGILFNRAAGLDLTAIPYQGSGPATVDLISGVVQLLIVSSPPVAEQIKAGTLRGLAVASPERLSILPDVPTVAEEGMPDLILSLWLGVMAPKDTPDAIVNKMNAAMRNAAKTDSVKQRAAQLGYTLQDLTARQMDELADKEVKTWVKIIRENNISFD